MCTRSSSKQALYIVSYTVNINFIIACYYSASCFSITGKITPFLEQCCNNL